MKKNIIIILLIISIYNFIGSDEITSEIEFGGKFNSNDAIASRGAIIEAVFILQFRKNFISNHIQTCKQILNEANLISKVLSLNKSLIPNNNFQELQLKHFDFAIKKYDHKQFITLETHIMQTASNLASYNTNIYKVKVSNTLYPDYIKQLNEYLTHVESTIKTLTQDGIFSYKEVRNNVDCATLMQEISQEEENISDIFYDIYKCEDMTKIINGVLSVYQKQSHISKFELMYQNLKQNLSIILNSTKSKRKKLKENTENLLKLNNELNQKFGQNNNSINFYKTLLAQDNYRSFNLIEGLV